MHYQNGREAKAGDMVVGKNINGGIVAGTIHNLCAGACSCNAQLQHVMHESGNAVNNATVTLADLLHAEDAYRYVNEDLRKASDALSLAHKDVAEIRGQLETALRGVEAREANLQNYRVAVEEKDGLLAEANKELAGLREQIRSLGGATITEPAPTLSETSQAPRATTR